MTRNGAPWKVHPQALKRLVLYDALTSLADTLQHRDPDTYQRTFRQVYRVLDAHARPELQLKKNQEPATRIAYLTREPPTIRTRWKMLQWFVEAWWNAGWYGADPKSPELTADELVTPDPDANHHFYAIRAYRTLVGDALQRDIHASTLQDPEHATLVKDRTYHYLRALVHPVLRRLPPQRRAVQRTWSNHRPNEPTHTTRARRLDTIPHFIDAWQHAGVIGHRTAPTDTESGTSLLEQIPDQPTWLQKETTNDA